MRLSTDRCFLILSLGIQFVVIFGSMQDGFQENGGSWRLTRKRQARHLGASTPTTNAILDRGTHSTKPQTAEEMFALASDNAIQIVSPPELYPDIQKPGHFNDIRNRTRSARAGNPVVLQNNKALVRRNDQILKKAETPRTGMILLSTIGMIESVIVSSALLGMGGAAFTSILILIQFVLRALLVFFTGVYFL